MRIHFYEYLDIVDSSNKLEELEKRGKKEDKYSWCILVDELKRKVIINDHIKKFIKKTEKSIAFSHIYYDTINKYIDDTMDRFNNENNENLLFLKKMILLDSLEDENFYLLQKIKIYQEMVFISKLYDKINKNQDTEAININKLKDFICEKLKVFEKRKNIIKLIKKGFITNEDDVIINIKNIKDIIIALDLMDNNNKKYNNVKLPKFIKIREYNQYSIVLNNTKPANGYSIYNYIKMMYKNIILNGDKHFKDNTNLYLPLKIHFYYNTYMYIVYFTITHVFNLGFILIFNIYKILHYFDLWRKKHKK